MTRRRCARWRRKELRQIARDRRTLMILLFVPAFFLLLYGYALNFDIRHIRLARRRPRRHHARAATLVSAFVNSGYFDLRRPPCTAGARARAADRPQRGARRAGHSRRLRPRRRQPARRSRVQVIIDGDNANTATTVMGYAAGDRRRSCRRATSRRRAPARPRGAAADASSRASGTTPAAQHAVPGARPDRLHRDDHRRGLDRAVGRPREGARHDGAGADGAARPAVVRARQDDALFRHLARVGDAASSCVAMVLFDLPMRGSWLLLLAARSSLFLVGALGLGLLISTRRRDAAGRVSDGAAVVVPADADAVGLHLPDRQHAGGRCRSSPTSCRRATSSSRCAAIVLKGVGLDGRSGRELVALAIFAAGDARRWRRCGCGRRVGADAAGHATRRCTSCGRS